MVLLVTQSALQLPLYSYDDDYYCHYSHYDDYYVLLCYHNYYLYDGY